MKKLISLLLIVTMVLSLFTIVPISVGATQASPGSVQADNGLYVKLGDDLYEVNKGDIVTYNYYLTVNTQNKISSIDVNMSYDTEGLDLIPFTDEYGEIDAKKHFPDIYGGCVGNFNIDGKIYYNYSSVTGVRLKNDLPLFTCQFKVTASEGTYEIGEQLVTLADVEMNKIVYAEEIIQKIFTEKSEIAEITPADSTTETKTIYFLNNAQWDFVNAYYWGSSVKNCEYWPGDALELFDANGKYDIYCITVPSDIEGLVFNGYCTKTDMNTQTTDIYDSENDDCYYITSVDESGWFSKAEKDKIDIILAENNDDTSTHTYTVAGGLLSGAGMLGTTWDPKNIANDMTYDEATGLWSITYTNVLSTGHDWYEYKIAQDHSFDVSYGANTGAIYENGKIKVAADNSTVTIYFDGKRCWSEVEGPTYERTKTIYFLNNKNWTNVKAYYWSLDFNICAPWPGEILEVYDDTGKYDIYYVTVPEEALGIIFNGENPVTGENNQTKDLIDPQDGYCYYIKGTSSNNWHNSGIEPIDSILQSNKLESTTHTYTAVGDMKLFGSSWDASNESNDLTYDENTKLWSITYENVAAKAYGYEYKVIEDRLWNKAFTEEGIDQGGALNAKVEVTVDNSTVTIYFDGKKCWSKVVPPEISTENTGKHVYVVVDGKKHEVSKGNVYTYKYTMSVDDALKISSIDINIFYDKTGLEFIPFVDSNSDVEADKHFPKIHGSCVYNLSTDGEIRFNYSSVAGVKLVDKAVVFTGQFAVTADEGTYNIDSSLMTLADTNLNKIVYNSNVIQPDVYSVNTIFGVKTSGDTDQTEKPETPLDPEGLYIKVGDKYYEAKAGKEYEFVYTLNGGKNRISAIDARVEYDTEGLDFVPVCDEDGYYDLSSMFPILESPAFNPTVDGTVYFNYASAHGTLFNNDNSILFKGKFKVTATEGVYEINPYIYCLEDAKENILVNEGIVCGKYRDNASINYDGPCVKLGNNYYEALQGQEYEFVYYLQVEDKRIGVLDARVSYDAEGLEFIPAVDSYGDEDTLSMFPIVQTPVFNHTIDGMLYFNYVSLNGVKFQSEDSVLFRGKFKVTATEGVYEIRPFINCLGDTDRGVIVNESVICAEFKENFVLTANYEIGDANRDGEVTILDVSEIQRYLAGYTAFDGKQMEFADMNKDGSVNIFDATAVSRYLAYDSDF